MSQSIKRIKPMRLQLLFKNDSAKNLLDIGNQNFNKKCVDAAELSKGKKTLEVMMKEVVEAKEVQYAEFLHYIKPENMCSRHDAERIVTNISIDSDKIQQRQEQCIETLTHKDVKVEDELKCEITSILRQRLNNILFAFCQINFVQVLAQIFKAWDILEFLNAFEINACLKCIHPSKDEALEYIKASPSQQGLPIWTPVKEELEHIIENFPLLDKIFSELQKNTLNQSEINIMSFKLMQIEWAISGRIDKALQEIGALRSSLMISKEDFTMQREKSRKALMGSCLAAMAGICSYTLFRSKAGPELFKFAGAIVLPHVLLGGLHFNSCIKSEAQIQKLAQDHKELEEIQDNAEELKYTLEERAKLVQAAILDLTSEEVGGLTDKTNSSDSLTPLEHKYMREEQIYYQIQKH